MCSDQEPNELHARVIHGTRDHFDEIQDCILNVMRRCRYTDHDLFSVRVAIEEALANALLHAHQGNENCEIEVTWKVDEDTVEITVTDQGLGYDPATIPDPTAQENLTLPSGRGLAMIRAFMDEVHLNDCGNQVKMIRTKRI